MGKIPFLSLLNISLNSGTEKTNEIHGNENTQATEGSKIKINYDKSESGQFVSYLKQQLSRANNDILKLTEQKNYFQYRLNLLQKEINEIKQKKERKARKRSKKKIRCRKR